MHKLIKILENLCGFALYLCMKMCVNMADPSQLTGVGGGNALKNSYSQQGLNEKKSFVTICCLSQGCSTKTTGILIYIMLTIPK